MNGGILSITVISIVFRGTPHCLLSRATLKLKDDHKSCNEDPQPTAIFPDFHEGYLLEP
jgi:hypothetical protein